MSEKYLLAIDQGTSGTKAVIFNEQGQLVCKGMAELRSCYPQARFVEQDPNEIYQNVLDAVGECLKVFREMKRDVNAICACGISNQRETYLLWDNDGEPLYNAIVWQCKRSVEICNRLKGTTIEEDIRTRTGLIVDPYFSGTKVMWLYENDPDIRKAIDNGQAKGGTVDTWLLYKLTNGHSYLTDYTNACRTLFFNIDNFQWDNVLLGKFNLTPLNVPNAVPSAFDFGETTFDGLLPHAVPVTGMIGDSHAAAFGEGCFHSGDAKATLGTGSSILMNTGDKRVSSQNGMVSTICWSLPKRTDYALEGIIVTAGASIKWLRDQLGLFIDTSDTERMARAVADNNGVYLVPAFSGLGAPHWKMSSRAVISGLTFGADKNHIVRAALETIPYQIKDVISAMQSDAGISLQELKCDGGMTANAFVMQFIADILDTKVTNLGISDVSALGAAYMAGIGCGLYKDVSELEQLSSHYNEFVPVPEKENVKKYYQGWLKAVNRLPEA